MASSEESDVSQHTERLMDIAGEPQRMLPPIQGYENMPLVSLEESVQWLEEDIPRIQEYALDAKEKCSKPPADGLSLDESAAIRLYTMEWPKGHKSLYSELNRVLRDANREHVKKYFRYMKLLITSLFKIPSSERRLFRGVRLNLSEQYRQGQTMIWWAFSSCTDRLEVLENPKFMGKEGERTQFEIHCLSAKDIRRHSRYQTENELLLMAATQFRVTSTLNAGNGLHIITLREIEPTYPLIQRPRMVQGNRVEWPSATTEQPLPLPMPEEANVDLQRRIGRYQLHAAINLDNMRLTDRDMNIVVESAIREKQCTRLCLSNNQIRSVGIRLLANGIRESTTLLDLDLSYNGLSDVDVQPLAIELSSHQADERESFPCFRMCRRPTIVGPIQSLNLSHNQISDAGATAIAEVIRTKRTLLNLHLSDNRINDSGVADIGEALQQPGVQLQRLYLNNNASITDRSVDPLLRMLEQNQSLQTLWLTDCGFTDNGRGRLRERQQERRRIFI